MKYLLGFDIGSSSVKATLLEIASGKTVASAFSPSSEMPMQSTQPGFAEQDPEMWWRELVNAMNKLHQQVSFTWRGGCCNWYSLPDAWSCLR